MIGLVGFLGGNKTVADIDRTRIMAVGRGHCVLGRGYNGTKGIILHAFPRQKGQVIGGSIVIFIC